MLAAFHSDPPALALSQPLTKNKPAAFKVKTRQHIKSVTQNIEIIATK